MSPTMQATPHLDLPYIMPAQAQKHVTHNDALDMVDALLQLAVVSRALRSPELREQLRQARTVDAIKALFVKDQAPATAA